MNTQSYKTQSANKESVTRAWWIVDAEGQTLGRMATKIATILRGKHKPSFTPHVDCGDFVVVINSDKIILSGNKMEDKLYHSYTGYPGGLRKINPKDLLAKKPEAVVERAVKGMIPKNKLGSAVFRKLFVYADDNHPHGAQKPKNLEI